MSKHHISRAKVLEIVPHKHVKKLDDWGYSRLYLEPGYVLVERTDTDKKGEHLRVELRQAPRDLEVGEDVWVYYQSETSFGLHAITRNDPRIKR